MLSNFGLSGGGISGLGISGMGFGQAPPANTAPLNQYVGATPPKGKLGAVASDVLSWFKGETNDPWAGGSSAPSTQSQGVAQYGNVWASKNCASCDAAIRAMQSQVNRAGAALGTPISIAVDGKVGPATVTAFQTVARAAVTRGFPSGAALLAYSTPELIAKNADKARDLLSTIGDKAGAPVVSTTPTTIPSLPGGGGSTIPTSTLPTQTVVSPGLPYPASATPTIKSNRMPFIIGGLILAVGVGAAVVILKTK